MRIANLLLPAVAACVGGCPRQAAVPAPAADIVVALDGSGDHTSIQSAIEVARAGDVVYVKAEAYREALMVGEGKRVRLVGAGSGAAVIDAREKYAALTLAGDDCHVEGFTIRGASSHGAYVKGTGHRVRRCLIIKNDDRGVCFRVSAAGRRLESSTAR